MYTKTNWVDNTTPIDKDNLNKIEQGIYDNSIRIETQNVTTANTNLNDYTENGIYYFNSNAVTPTNIPAGVNGWLQVIKGADNTVIKQIWFRHGTANSNDYETYVRTYTSATWSNWKKYVVDKGVFKLVKSTQRTDLKWMKLCNVKYRAHSQGEFFNLKIFIGDGNNGRIDQNAYIDLNCQLGYINDAQVAGRFGCNAILYPSLTGFTTSNTNIKVIANSNTDYDIWFYTSRTQFCNPNYIAYGSDLVTVTQKFELSDNAPTGTECNLDYLEIADANKPIDISSLLTSDTGTVSLNTSFKVGKVITISCVVTSVAFTAGTWIDVLEVDSTILPRDQEFPYIFLPGQPGKLDNSYMTTGGVIKVKSNTTVTTNVQIFLTYSI